MDQNTLEGLVPGVTFKKLSRGEAGRIKVHGKRSAVYSDSDGTLRVQKYEPLPPNQVDVVEGDGVRSYVYPTEFYLIAQTKTKKEGAEKIIDQYRAKIAELKKFSEENGVSNPEVAVTCRIDIRQVLVEPENCNPHLFPEADLKKLKSDGPFYYSQVCLGLAAVGDETT